MTDKQGCGAYTVATLAVRVGCSAKAVRKWIAQGRVAGVVRCGRSIRIDQATTERRLLSGELLLPAK